MSFSDPMKSRDLESQITDCKWNTAEEKLAAQIGGESAGYRTMHRRAAWRQRIAYNALMFSGIVIGPLSALVSSVNSMLNPDTDVIIPMISAGLGVISGMVIAAIKFGKFNESSTRHQNSAAEFLSLQTNISRQLVLGRTERQNAGSYISYIGDAYADIFKRSPMISETDHQKYAVEAKAKNLPVPGEYNIQILKHPTLAPAQSLLNLQVANTPFSDGRIAYELQRLNDMKV